MAVIERILFDLEVSSRHANSIDEAVDTFAFGVGKVVARLRLEIDVARESRDLYRNKRDQLREELQRKESFRSVSSNNSSGLPTPVSTSEDSTRARDDVSLQYAALACQPELLDDDPQPPPLSPRSGLAGPFRRSVASAAQRSGNRPLSPRAQPAQAAPAVAVPSKPSRANKAEIKPNVSPAPNAPVQAQAKMLPVSSSPSPPVKPTKAAKQDLQPRPAVRAVAQQHYMEFKLPGTYVDLDLDLSRNTMYGHFDRGEVESQFGEFPDDVEEE